MQWIKKIVFVTAVASLSSGCAMYELEELRQTAPTGTPFQKELARLYMDFATEDEKGYDWFNSWYFADKGLRSAYGKTVTPEDLNNWNISPEALPSLQRARGELMVMLTPDNEDQHPTAAAEAQFYFDCWVQRQEENWQSDRIEYCRNGFSSALDELGAPKTETSTMGSTKPSKKHKAEAKESKAEMMTPKAEPTKAAEKSQAVELKGTEDHKTAKTAKTEKSEKADKDDEAETMSYVVFFAGERPVITEPGEQVLDDVIKSLKGTNDYEIVLKGGVGSDPKSPLFASRIEAVTQRLTEGGIKTDAIKTGESESGQAARRIEIFLSQ